MPNRVFTEAQKEVNRKRTKLWRVAAKEKGREYLKRFSTMLARAGLVISVVHSSATANDHTLSNTPPLQLDAHCPQNSWRTDHQQLQALEIAEANMACQHQLE